MTPSSDEDHGGKVSETAAAAAAAIATDVRAISVDIWRPWRLSLRFPDGFEVNLATSHCMLDITRVGHWGCTG